MRIFEWNGTMLHAKTAVADRRWARVGSTNLNPASWFSNCELDVLVDDETFGRQMEAMYLEDLGNATEVVLDDRSRVRPRGNEPDPAPGGGGGSAGRAAAGLLRIGNTVSAAVGNRRTIEPVEPRITLAVAIALLIVAALMIVFPRLIAYPLAAIAVWIAGALIYRCGRRGRSGPHG